MEKIKKNNLDQHTFYKVLYDEIFPLRLLIYINLINGEIKNTFYVVQTKKDSVIKEVYKGNLDEALKIYNQLAFSEEKDKI